MGYEVVSPVIVEQDHEDNKQRQAAGTQQEPWRYATPASWNHFADGYRSPEPYEDTQRGKDQCTFQNAERLNAVEPRSGRAGQSNGRTNQSQPARQDPCRRQGTDRTQRGPDGFGDMIEQRRVHLMGSLSGPLQDFVDLFIPHERPPVRPLLSSMPLSRSLNLS